MEVVNKKVLVVGLGVSGIAATRLALQKGAQVRAVDAKNEIKGAEELAALGVEVMLGKFKKEDFAWAEIIILSPGVDHRQAEIASARKNGAQIIGELGFAYQYITCPNIMITGSNGKTTVSTLIARILKASNYNVFAGGNLGTPLSQLILDEEKPDWAVLEVSSFQTDTSDNLKPNIGIVLNVSPDHMDRYDSFDGYADSKFKILTNQTDNDLAILCTDDPQVAARSHLAPAKVLRYGKDYPKRDSSAWLQGNYMVFRMPGREPLMIDISGSQLVGSFNRLNLLAAAAACLYVGISPEVIRREINQFAGLPHRLFKVGEVNGISFYDDSKATNVGAVQAALLALEKRTILLLGGRDKDGCFIDLLAELQKTCAGVVCFGEAGGSIYRQLNDSFPCQVVEDLSTAVNTAFNMAAEGQAILLSPGCASFDAYTGYAQRGDHFIQLVKAMMEKK